MRGPKPAEIVDGIYQAALSPGAWHGSLEVAAGGFDGEILLLYVLDQNAQLVRGIVGAPYTEEAFDEYCMFYQDKDLRFPRFFQSPRYNVPLRTGDLISRQELARCPVHQEFYRQQDLWRLVVQVTPVADDHLLIVAGHRPRRYPEFDAAEAGRFARYARHMAQAVNLAHRVGGLELRAAGAEQAVDALGTGVALVDRQGVVRYANRRAEEVLRAGDGIVTRGGRLGCVRHDDDARIHRLLGESLDTSRGENLSGGGTLAISRADGRRPYRVDVAPLPRSAPVLGREDAVAAILITDPDRKPDVPEALLRRMFDLTAREARISLLLAEGQSAAAVAERLALSVRTVQVHTRSIYRKCRVKRQAQLVRLIGTLEA